MSKSAEIIAVGTEILLGEITNTDAVTVAQALSELGINAYYQTVVGDNPERLRECIKIAKSRADIIITTGGLGPTFDDLTKQVAAEAYGRKLGLKEEEHAKSKGYLARRGRKMPARHICPRVAPFFPMIGERRPAVPLRMRGRFS